MGFVAVVALIVEHVSFCSGLGLVVASLRSGGSYWTTLIISIHDQQSGFPEYI